MVVVTAEELEGNQIKHAAGSIHICWLAGSGVARQPKLPQRKLRSLKKYEIKIHLGFIKLREV